MTYRGQTATETRNGFKLTTHMMWSEFMKPLQARKPFTTGGALSGTDHPYGTGYLPEKYRHALRYADYAVYSYGTPIAFHISSDGFADSLSEASDLVLRLAFQQANANGVWIVPPDKYSPTTSKHQSKIATAISQLNSGEFNG